MGTSEMCYWCFYLLRHPHSSSLQLCQSIAQQHVASWPLHSAHNTQHAKERSMRKGRQRWFGTWPRRERLKVKSLLCTNSCLSVGSQGWFRSGAPECKISHRRQNKNVASEQWVISPSEPKSLWHVTSRGVSGKQIGDKLRNTRVHLSVPSIHVETHAARLN